MSLHSVIKSAFIGLCLCYSFVGVTQEDKQNDIIEDTEEKSSVFSSKERQRYMAFSVGYQNPISSGDNFIGSALNGKSGYDLRFKLFVYKQFFLEYNNSLSYFKVGNKALVGNYRKSRFEGNFLYVGYEFLPLPDFRVGVNAALFGKTKITNSGFNLGEGIQQDSGNLSSYGLYVAYEIHSHVSLYIDYSYRSIKTNIKAPQGLESFFEKGTYNTIGFGVMFIMGKRDLVSRFLN
ncbi:hypothetical protein [uncultured Winogradskyella sp.]|uniref:hypothetical protein n=1 Tax=uncultured Winogradskyella sp. TaxID=395353 RepID=UPI00261B24FF|nr:hypothetical protein [uncultured Winogradskyella sp.]|tara:strand:- start:2669 stop:3373 length:705 start_codon:yes stop_codon:yes gene_type:complete